MTIPSTSIRADYTSTGVNIPHTFSFCVFDITKLEVIVTDLSWNDTIQSSTAYSVVGIKAATDYTEGGTLTFVTEPTSGYHIAIISNEDGTQNTSIKNNSEYYAVLHENEFDKLAIKDLQAQEQLDKAMRAPDSEPAGTANLTLPAIPIRKLSYPYFDVNGNLTMVPGVFSPVIQEFFTFTTITEIVEFLGTQTITDWIYFIPTFCPGWNISGIDTKAYWRRVGNTLEVRMQVINAGGVTATDNLYLILPYGLSVDLSNVPLTYAGDVSLMGKGTLQRAGGTPYEDIGVGFSLGYNPTQIRVFISGNFLTPDYFTDYENTLTLEYKVPIAGWS